MFLHRVLADLVLCIHVAIVGFNILGLLLTVVGLLRGWRWVRNLWFRLAHLGVVGIVVLQAWCGAVCPLTKWENYFRANAGQATYPGGFLAHWANQMLFFEAEFWVFTLCYTIFGGLVLLSWIFGPPCWSKRSGRGGAENCATDD